MLPINVQASIHHIPDDILKKIGTGVDFKDCRNLRATCKRFYVTLGEEQGALYEEAVKEGRMYELPTAEELNIARYKRWGWNAILFVPLTVLLLSATCVAVFDIPPALHPSRVVGLVSGCLLFLALNIHGLDFNFVVDPKPKKISGDGLLQFQNRKPPDNA